MNTASATYSSETGTLTITVDGATEIVKCKPAAFLVVATGNPYKASGIAHTRHSTRALALKAMNVRGAGQVVEVVAK